MLQARTRIAGAVLEFLANITRFESLTATKHRGSMTHFVETWRRTRIGWTTFSKLFTFMESESLVLHMPIPSH